MEVKTKIVGHKIIITDKDLEIIPITETYIEESLSKRCWKAIKKDILYFIVSGLFAIHSYNSQHFKFAMFYCTCFGFVLALCCIKIMSEILKNKYEQN